MEHRQPGQVSGQDLPVGVEEAEPVDSPQPAHFQRDDDEDDEREATELRARTPTARGNEVNSIGSYRSERRKPHWHDPITKFWKRQINVSVPHVDSRDHLANERTYLAYLRTSLALSMIGVLVSQLFKLQQSPIPSSIFGYYVLGLPLAATFQASALCMALLGSFRFWRQQNSMARGKVWAGGWEIYLICVFVLLLLIALFVLHVGVDSYKDSNVFDHTGKSDL